MNAIKWPACGVAALGWMAYAGVVDAQGIEVRVNGDPVRFVNAGPQEYRGRVLVPLRGVLEKLGAYVGWDAPSRTVIATRGDLSLRLPIGSAFAEINDRRVALDVPAMTVNGTTMVPLRFVGESLGADVRWDAGARAVLIQTREVAANPPDQSDVREFRRRERIRREREEPVAAPILPPAPAPLPPLAVTSISHNLRDNWIRPGQDLTVRMRGTPGAEGRFRIPGLAQEVPMREVEPGVYEGVWTAPADRPSQIGNASIIGSLRSGGRESPLIQANDPVRVDTIPPLIEDLQPASGSVVPRRRPAISAAFDDQNGSGVARDRVAILLDRVDVTRDAVITDRFVTYKPTDALMPGDHSVDLIVQDQAGNRTSKRWTFSVARQQAGIRSVQANTDRVLEPGDVLRVRVEGMPGSRAAFSVGGIRNVPLAEQSPGLYMADYTIRKGDDVASSPLAVTLITPDGERLTDVVEQKVRISTGPPAAPIIVFPGKNDRLTNPLVLRGTAPPNSTVRLKIEYVNRLLGVLAVRGTADEEDIKTGPDGRWTSRPVDISTLLGSRGTEYTISATTISRTNVPSAVTSLRIGGR